jgi:hypothetical protein
MRRFRWPDRLGMIVAIGCGVHCAAMTMVFFTWPALWLNRSLWERGVWQQLILLERSLLGLAWLLIVAAAIAGWFSHRRWHPAVIGLTGAGVMTIAIVSPLHALGYRGSIMALIGGLMVALAHWLNLRLLNRCG